MNNELEPRFNGYVERGTIMIHKATATCSNGHTVEFGTCDKETTKFFFLKSNCTSQELEVLSRHEIQCKKCKAIHMARPCRKCNDHVPVEKFKQQTDFEKLMTGSTSRK